MITIYYLYHDLNTKRITGHVGFQKKSLGTIQWLFWLQYKQNPNNPLKFSEVSGTLLWRITQLGKQQLWDNAPCPRNCADICSPVITVSDSLKKHSVATLFDLCQFEMQYEIYQQSPALTSKNGGFPGGAVVGSLPANAGDTGSSPGLGGSRVPRSDWAHEPQLLSLRVWSLCSTTGEAAIVRGPRTAMKSGPRLPQLGEALAQKRRPNTAKNK